MAAKKPKKPTKPTKPKATKAKVTKATKAKKATATRATNAKAAKATTNSTTSKPMAKAAPPKATATQSAGLSAVERAIEVRDAAGALAAANAWWRDTRAPAVGELVAAISARISPPVVANDGDFARIAQREDPALLGALLPAVPELSGSFMPAAAELLLAFPDDARLGVAVATYAQDPPTTSSSTYPFWTRLLGVAAKSRDARAAKLLRKRLAKPQDRASQFWPKFYAALAKAADAIDADAGAEVDKATKQAIAALDLAKLPALADAAALPSKVAVDSGPALTGPLLEQAAKHFAAKRVGPAIAAMVARWREHKAAELADLIERATTLLPSFDLPLCETEKKSLDPWLEKSADAATYLPQLLDNITTGGAAFAERRLVALGELDDDPRVARALAALCERRDASPERTLYWRSVLELLARIADPRLAPALAHAFNDFKGTYYNHHRQATRIIKPYVDLAVAAGALVLDPADRKHAAAIAKQLDTLVADAPAHALVAAVADRRASTAAGAHLVYADWLTERGHPRGELVVLSETATPSAAEAKRIAELLAVPGIDGPLGRLGEVSQRDRGLPTSLAVGYWCGSLNATSLIGHPLTPMVKTIVFERSAKLLPSELARLLTQTAVEKLVLEGDRDSERDGSVGGEVAAMVAPRFRYDERTRTFARA